MIPKQLAALPERASRWEVDDTGYAARMDRRHRLIIESASVDRLLEGGVIELSERLESLDYHTKLHPGYYAYELFKRTPIEAVEALLDRIARKIRSLESEAKMWKKDHRAVLLELEGMRELKP